MGVDAEMLVINPKDHHLTNRQVQYLSYQLASKVGPENFIINHPEQRKLYPDTLERHHAVSILGPLTKKKASDYGVPHLTGKVVWFQDGPEIVAEDWQQFLRVHLSGRYYGPSYARGRWSVYYTTIQLLKMLLPKAKIMYGGDSSGICVEEMTDEKVKEYNDYWLGRGNQDYWMNQVRSTGHRCQTCEVPMTEAGGGRGDTFWACAGCGRRSVTSPDGRETTSIRAGDLDIFNLAAKHRGETVLPSYMRRTLQVLGDDGNQIEAAHLRTLLEDLVKRKSNLSDL